jgi:hypothetical protein
MSHIQAASALLSEATSHLLTNSDVPFRMLSAFPEVAEELIAQRPAPSPEEVRRHLHQGIDFFAGALARYMEDKIEKVWNPKHPNTICRFEVMEARIDRGDYEKSISGRSGFSRNRALITGRIVFQNAKGQILNGAHARFADIRATAHTHNNGTLDTLATIEGMRLENHLRSYVDTDGTPTSSRACFPPAPYCFLAIREELTEPRSLHLTLSEMKHHQVSFGELQAHDFDGFIASVIHTAFTNAGQKAPSDLRPSPR